MEKECGRYSYLYYRYSVSYLTLTAGDKGIKCPSVSSKQCRKRPSGRHRSPRWPSCQRRLPPCTPGCTASRHACPGGPLRDTWVDVLERGCGVAACRGKCLAAAVVLSGPGACRSPSLAGTRGALRQAFLGCHGWPSRQAPLARALSPWLEYFVLEWLPGKLLLPGSCLLRSHGGSWR